MHAKSKTLATWLALLLGSLGAHRFYLKGWRDLAGWLHPLPTLLGIAGALRMYKLGVDDHAAWEEEAVTFGPAAADACGKEGLAAKLRQVRRPAPGVEATAAHPPTKVTRSPTTRV